MSETSGGFESAGLGPGLVALAEQVGAKLVEAGQKVAVGESSCGGLLSAGLLAVPGASAFYLGGAVIYTGAARGLLFERDELPSDVRGATSRFGELLAAGAADKMGAEWGLGETGATGPSGNPYGDPAGHAWVAVRRPDGTTVSRQVSTGDNDRAANMAAFAAAAYTLLLDQLSSP